jgi:hypothetical protein
MTIFTFAFDLNYKEQEAEIVAPTASEGFRILRETFPGLDMPCLMSHRRAPRQIARAA